MERSFISNNLKKYRQTIGYSQKEVAFFLGLTYVKNISRWEKGNILPCIKHLFALSHLYNAVPNELYPNLWQSLKSEVDETKISVELKKDEKAKQYFYL